VSTRKKDEFKLTFGQYMAQNKASYILIAPYFILFFMFTILPVLSSMTLSFTYFNVLEFPTWVGWSNYTRLIFRRRFVYARASQYVDFRACNRAGKLCSLPVVRLDNKRV
jgi:ABC-type sugar transport system permease subunit